MCHCVNRCAHICLYLKHDRHHHHHHYHPSGVLTNGLFPFPHNSNIPGHSGMLRNDRSRGNRTLRRFHHVTVVTVDTKVRNFTNRLWFGDAEEVDVETHELSYFYPEEAD